MSLSAEQRSVRDCVLRNAMLLSVFQEQFGVAINLFDLIDRTNPPLDVLKNEYHAYRMIAARDAALSVYHFKCCIDVIKKQLPRMKSQVDGTEIAEIARRFTKSFPHAESVRHGIAHAADKFKSPELMKVHGMKVSSYGPGFAIDEGGYLFSSLHGRTYSVGNKGEVFSVTLDHAALADLRDIRSSVANALVPIIERQAQLGAPG